MGIARIKERLAEARGTIDTLANDEAVLADVAALAASISGALAAGGRVWLFGNGGSAADAQHLAAELVGRFRCERRPLPAEALTVNTSALTAIANDYGFDHVFSRQIEAHARPGDVAVGISTSGRSENVRRALATARSLGLRTAALTGAGGEGLRDAVETCIIVPTWDTARIQECHIVIGHIVCELVEEMVG